MESTSKKKRGRQQWKPDFSYDVDYCDHFETPLRAYEEILPLLDSLNLLSRNESKGNENAFVTPSKESQKKLRGLRKNHILYDPYYCDGRTKVYLESFGFEHVVHEKRDFYKDIRNSAIPEHHVLVTNPPYSDTHKEQCLEFCVKQFQTQGRPFLLLMPNYVAARGYYRRILGDCIKDMVYLVPKLDYEYDHPEGTGHDIPPFSSLWFCGVGRQRVQKMKHYWETQVSETSGNGPRFVTSLEELVDLGIISMQNRPNPRQRRKKRKMLNTDNDKPTASTGNSNSNQQTNKKQKRNSRYRDEMGKRTKKRF